MGKAIIITAPSGAGKTTLVNMLLAHRKDVAFSISACTRKMRDYETDGKDYYFLSVNEFKTRIANNEFLEHEEVYKNMFYGTLKSEVDRIWSLNKSVIFDIDVKGAVNLKKYLGDNALAIFIEPPSIDTLMQRLKGRNTETQETLGKRFAKATIEMAYRTRMDTAIINDNLDIAFEELNSKVDEFINLSS